MKDFAQFLGSHPEGAEPDWDFIISTSSGETVVESPFIGVDTDTKVAYNLWTKYIGEHRTETLEKKEIFEIDLNTLISLDVELEMMFHTTVSVP